MPRASSAPRYPVRFAAHGFATDKWRLLTQLPAEIMIATIALREGGSRRTVAEGLAGLDAIAAGRGSDSDLVRAVVAAIYSEPEDDRPEPAAPPDGPPARRSGVLAECRRVADVLRGADPADAAAYRHWIQQVAVRVFGASRSGGVLGLSGETVPPVEREFLDDLATALS
ncbi:MAG: hypothetical protein GEV12_12465 [Micromonosporaceae bacterium]|nr:hypothetical protein [Micromonosporaceae bacterium]